MVSLQALWQVPKEEEKIPHREGHPTTSAPDLLKKIFGLTSYKFSYLNSDSEI